MAERSLNATNTSTTGTSIQTARAPLPEDQQLKHRAKDLAERLRAALDQVLHDLDPDTDDLLKEADALLGERAKSDYRDLEPIRRMVEMGLRMKPLSFEELPHLDTIAKGCSYSPEEVDAHEAKMHELVRRDRENRNNLAKLLRVEEVIARLEAAMVEAPRISKET